MDLHITFFIYRKTTDPKVSEVPNQEELAEMIGISVDTLNNYKNSQNLFLNYRIKKFCKNSSQKGE